MEIRRGRAAASPFGRIADNGGESYGKTHETISCEAVTVRVGHLP
jgi:hypothetical protein